MKLDLDCVRDILLGLESTLEYNDSGALSDGYTIQKLLENHNLKNYSKAQVLYTLRLMEMLSWFASHLFLRVMISSLKPA